MKNEIDHSIKLLSEALSRLSEGINETVNDLDEDGVIQRFEFTFELLWKTLKIFFEDHGILCKSPKDCLKAAFRYGLFEEDEVFMSMLNDRNKTSHIYNREDSRIIFLRIKNEYYSALKKLCGEIKIQSEE